MYCMLYGVEGGIRGHERHVSGLERGPYLLRHGERIRDVFGFYSLLDLLGVRRRKPYNRRLEMLKMCNLQAP